MISDIDRYVSYRDRSIFKEYDIVDEIFSTIKEFRLDKSPNVKLSVIKTLDIDGKTPGFFKHHRYTLPELEEREIARRMEWDCV